MKKMSKIIIVLCCMMTVLSCTYDYQYPDYTGIRSSYTVADINPEVKQQLLPIAVECGVTLQYASEQWRTLVTEKDAAGNILYQGEPRDRADSNTKVLMVSYICSCRLQSFDWKYYDICRFDFEKQYPIEITPIPISVAISPSDKYTVTKYPVYIYNIDRNLPVIEKVNSYGYTFADAIMTITEKDENGDVIQSFEHRTIDDEIVTDTAKTIDVEIALYGYTPNYERVYVGSYIFKDINLENINNTTLILTEDMEHEFVENVDITYSYNIDRSQLPTIEKIYSYGYTVADVNMVITEKDENGNSIRSFEHRTIDGMIYTTAKTIDVEIALYGYTSNYDKVYVGSYIFKDINLAKINGTTLTLTEDMEHEFVENPDL